MSSHVRISHFVLAFLLLPIAAPARAYDCPADGGGLAQAVGDQIHLSAQRYDTSDPFGAPYTLVRVMWRDDRDSATGPDLWASVFASCVQDPAPGAEAVCTDSSAQDFSSFSDTRGRTAPECCGQWSCEDVRLVVAWQDARGQDLDIWAKRLHGCPVLKFGAWDSVSVPVCTATGDQSGVAVVGDSNYDTEPGAVFAWVDRRAGEADIYAQSVDSTGAPLWGTNGMPVCDATGDQTGVRMFRESDHSVILCWLDARAGGSVFAVRLGLDGMPLPGWAAGGNRVSSAPAVATTMRAEPDGADGLFIAWTDTRAGSGGDVYVQRVLANGSIDAGWSADGVPVANGPYAERLADVDGDAGGVYVAWEDDRSVVPEELPPNVDIYAQRILPGGAVAPGWPAGGFPVCTDPAPQQQARIDGTTGSVLIGWSDLRSGTDAPDIYALKITGDGLIPTGWVMNGTRVCGAPDAQVEPIVTGAVNGGGRLAWIDYRQRATRGADVYATNVTFDGRVDVTSRSTGGLSLSAPRPNPAWDGASLTLVLPAPGPVTMQILDVAGRTVRVIHYPYLPSAEHTLRWDGRDQDDAPAHPGVYFVRVTSATGELARRLVLLD